MEITLDNWNGSHCKEEVYHINSSERLLEILEKLDAKQHTLVNLVLSEENYLMIGGDLYFSSFYTNQQNISADVIPNREWQTFALLVNIFTTKTSHFQ